MAQQTVTVTGNLTDNPEMRGATTNGGLKCNLRIASSRAFRDENAEGGWRTYDQLYISAEAWGDLAVNIRKSLRKGMPVIATGTLITHEWVTGQEPNETRHQRIVLKVQQIGLDLNRYVIGCRRTDVQEHNDENLDLPEGEAEDYIDRPVAGAAAEPELQPA